MIRLDALKYLEEVAKMKSIGKAADKLFMSKSALSSAIMKLEEEIGVSLLDRSAAGVDLTPAGRMVIEKSALLFEIVDQIKAESWIYKSVDGVNEINYYMTDSFGENLFPNLLGYFQQILGGARINVQNKKSLADIISSVKKDSTGIGFYLTAEVGLENLEGVACGCINEYRLDAVFAKYTRYLKDDVQEITMDELRKMPRVWLEHSYDYIPKNIDEFEEESSKIALKTSNHSIYFQAIKNDIGFGILPWIGSQFNLASRNDLRYVPVKDADVYYLYMITNVDCLPELRMKHENVLLKVLEHQE